MRTSRRMRRLARILSLLTIVALVVAMMPVMPVGAVEPLPVMRTWYVDASATTEGSGTVEDPFRSITSALTTAVAGESIEVAPGTYGEYETFPLSMFDTELNIYSTGGSEVTIIDGDGAPGPLVRVELSGLDMIGFTITGATMPEIEENRSIGGGGMFVGASDVYLEDLVITGNDAEAGAGIAVYESLAVMTDCVVTANGSHSPEPELQALGDIPVVPARGTQAGGGIHAVASMMLLDTCEISENLADFQGAGIYAFDTLLLTEQCTIARNWINEMAVQDVAVEAWDLDDASVANGVSRTDGGGVFAALSVVGFGDTAFSGNVGEFGAIAVEYSQLMLYGCEITGHEGFAAVGFDDNIYGPEPGEIIAGVDGRLSAKDGMDLEELAGAIQSGPSASPAQLAPDQYIDIYETTFTGNTGETVLFGWGGWLTMENCLLAGNDILYPTVGLQNTYGDILYSTFADNGSECSLWMAGPMSDVWVLSSILWDAAAESSGVLTPTETEMAPTILWDGNLGLLFDDLKSQIEYMGLIAPEDLDVYEGVISEDPRFMDSASGDYRLALGSPCVDTGFPEYWPGGDLVGNPRPIDGDEDGEALPDMGALEYIPSGRFGGWNRYATAIQIVEENFATAETVVIATGEQFADGLSASALCGLYDAPLLITERLELTEGVAEEIERLGASQAIIVGGINAVSSSVQQALEDLGLEVTRIGGIDRYETSALIAAHVIENTEFDGQVFMARGDRFPDALAVSPVAYANVIPVLLVRSDRLPDSVVEVLYDYDISSAAVLGGTAAIGTQVEVGTQMTLGVLTERIGGADRYETAALISEWAYGNGLASFETVGMTTGLDFPDALCGGAGIGTRGGVLLLTPATELNVHAEGALTDHVDEVDAVQFFGGLNALSEDVKMAVYDLLGW